MFEQNQRQLRITTPLGKDKLLLLAFQGREAVSQLFRYELQVAWNDRNSLLPFDQLLGKKITVEINPAAGHTRHFNGIVNRITQGVRDDNFTYYTLEVVPQLWLLDRKLDSRTFQHITIPDILQKLFTGLDVAYQVEGTFEPREYCVQYHETDFTFASRLMEEEGIYYFFKHTENGHQMVLANTPQSHPAIPFMKTAIWEDVKETENTLEPDRIFEWSKGQEIRSGKFVAWDHNFEMPDKHLEAEKAIKDSVVVGTVSHKLQVAENSKLVLYDYPGGYASRHDGVNKSGGDQASKLQDIFQDNIRTVGIRMEEEALGSLLIRGRSGHVGLMPGHTFELDRHYSDDGKYVLTTVEHDASQPLAVDPAGHGLHYLNWFNCIPFALPYRPVRLTPKPYVRGVQSATVVGSPGEEIFCDKYGRVKVQFHWDREGQNDANSSCWVRVATFWAGKQWGAVHLPRIGQEVIVDFVEGDINCPIIVGSVYNAALMPPWTLPDNKTISGVKSRSSLQGDPDNFNQLSFEDKKGSELVNFQAEKDLTSLVKHDETREVQHDRTTTIKNNETQIVKEGNEKIVVEKGNQSTEVTKGNQTIDIKTGNQTTTIDMGNQSLKIKMGNQTNKIDLGKIDTEAMQSIELKVGQSSIKLDQMGVTIKGMMIKVDAQIQCDVHAVMTNVKGDAMTMVKGGIVMIN